MLGAVVLPRTSVALGLNALVLVSTLLLAVALALLVLSENMLVGAALLGAGALTIVRWPLDDVFVERVSVPD